MNPRFTSLQKYLLFSFSYGFLRNSHNIYNDIYISTYDMKERKDKIVPVNLSRKIFLFTISSFINIYTFPVRLINDIERAEIYLRGRNVEDYGFKNNNVYNSEHDIIFT